jgi:hypothetical protein
MEHILSQRYSGGKSLPMRAHLKGVSIFLQMRFQRAFGPFLWLNIVIEYTYLTSRLYGRFPYIFQALSIRSLRIHVAGSCGQVHGLPLADLSWPEAAFKMVVVSGTVSAKRFA